MVPVILKTYYITYQTVLPEVRETQTRVRGSEDWCSVR